MADVKVRFARESDYKGVVEMSEGVYDGGDYLPLEYHEWIRMPSRQMFVAELDGKIIGLASLWIVDDGTTYYCEAARVHPKYRNRGVLNKISQAESNYIRRNYPNAKRSRSLTVEENIPAFKISQKTGQIILRTYRLACYVNDKTALEKRMRDIYPQKSVLPLSPYTKQEVQDTILTKPDAVGSLFLKGLAWIDLWALKVSSRSNIDYLFKDGDRMFADLSPAECSRSDDDFPRSFSHGRRSNRVKVTQWTCTIYTEDPKHFQAHMVTQLKAGMEQIRGPFLFNAFQSRNLIKECHKFAEDLKLEVGIQLNFVAIESDLKREDSTLSTGDRDSKL